MFCAEALRSVGSFRALQMKSGVDMSVSRITGWSVSARNGQTMDAILKFRLVMAICLCAGCSGGDELTLKTAETTGSVMYQGKPVAGATVVFIVAPTVKSPFPGSGETNELGEFRIKTGTFDGAAVGDHTVTVRKQIPPEFRTFMKGDVEETEPVGLPRNELPEKYLTPEKSPLKVSVKPDQPNVFKFELED